MGREYEVDARFPGVWLPGFAEGGVEVGFWLCEEATVFVVADRKGVGVMVEEEKCLERSARER